MKFIDHAEVLVKAGKGGNGIVSFRREARVSMGGPNGGDGGRGGNVIFRGEPGMNTLLNIKLQKHVFGNPGENGRNKNQYGAAGKDVIIKIPIGTIVYAGDKLICDIVEQKDYIIAKGGNGGRGNSKFKSAKNTAPQLSENGEKGEKHLLQLTLKVLADVGLVGKPNAGKSTLLSKLSNAKPKIDNYEFTTLNPQLGLVKAGSNSFVIADLPGLIAGASLGKGLGLEFLKHIERCKVIAHIIDFGDPKKDPIADYLQIEEELTNYSLGLHERAKVIVANKQDLEAYEEHIQKFKSKFPELKIVEISALKEINLNQLKLQLYETYKNAKEITYETKVDEVTIKLETSIKVTKHHEGLFEISGSEVERIYNKIPLNTNENFMRFNQKLKDLGVWKELEKKNIQDGDFVRIFEYEFQWTRG